MNTNEYLISKVKYPQMKNPFLKGSITKISTKKGR